MTATKASWNWLSAALRLRGEQEAGEAGDHMLLLLLLLLLPLLVLVLVLVVPLCWHQTGSD